MSDLPFIVGLAGAAGSGKSTIARAYARTSPHIIATAFARPLYQLAAQFCYNDASRWDILSDPATKEVPWTSENAPIPTLVGWTPRKLMQVLGTECIRKNIGPNVWVEKMLESARASKDHGFRIVVLEDVRFVDEAAACNCVVEVSRPGVGYAGNHASAMRLPDHLIHVYLYNDRSVDAMVQSLTEIIDARR